MKQTILLVATILAFVSCTTTRQIGGGYNAAGNFEVPITQSLFDDKNSSISEENIQKILDGIYQLPEKFRIAIVKLESKQYQQRNYWRYWTDERHMKAQQSYLELFTDNFKKFQQITSVSVIPDLLISSSPTFVTIRESAVRTQADFVAIYSITSELYTKENWFSSPDIKAFATTEFLLLDVRTGLIPFSTIVRKDYQSRKQKEDFNDEAVNERVKNEAVLLTIREIISQLTEFFERK